jgi:hypothetical protein
MDIRTIAPMAIPYGNSYRYLWSARPHNQTQPELLPKYDNKMMIAQPKLNGDNMLLFMNDTGFVQTMNRHDEDKKGTIDINYAKLYRGKSWMVLNGEWMAKSKSDEYHRNFNGNFVIFEILVYDGQILCGSTVSARLQLLNELYGSDTYKVDEKGDLQGREHLYVTNIPNVYRVASYENNFKAIYDQLIKIDMMEGLVLKTKSAMLTPPFNETANQKWQIKCRKPTKIYPF